MGMFDYIECEMPLPADPKPPADLLFQTKDTDDIADGLYLRRWTIEADGRLTLKGVAYPFHGDLRFYEFDTHTDEWWEYVARFTEGLCTGIRCTEHRSPASLTPQQGDGG